MKDMENLSKEETEIKNLFDAIEVVLAFESQVLKSQTKENCDKTLLRVLSQVIFDHKNGVRCFPISKLDAKRGHSKLKLAKNFVNKFSNIFWLAKDTYDPEEDIYILWGEKENRYHEYFEDYDF